MQTSFEPTCEVIFCTFYYVYHSQDELNLMEGVHIKVGHEKAKTGHERAMKGPSKNDSYKQSGP